MRFALFLAAAAAPLLPLVVTPAFSQDRSSAPQSDPDFNIQGEYSGERNSMQVIALGDGEFEIVVHEGPLGRTAAATAPPRRLDGDEDAVAEIAEALDLKRVQRKSPTLGAAPPAGAVVLFDGSEKSLANWQGGRRSEDGLLMQGTETKQTFRDYTLHLEFRTPWMPKAQGQARGNSGVYHQGRYETQILDSFGLSGQSNETGGIYEVKAPDVNACLPPMQWQTYDVDFTAARFEGDNKVADARLTVRLNGVTVQNDIPVPRATRAAKFGEGPGDGPIYLQDHGNEVRFRNIWLLPRDAEREASRPIVPGFERFFATGSEPQAIGGELLISSLGCTACHAGQTGPLAVKSGPNLSKLRQRVRPDAVVAMIANPHQTKRGTTMPDPWMGLNSDQRQTAAESIASFLLLSGDSNDLVDRAAKPSAVKRGEELYHSVGCVACHTPLNGTKTPLATTVPIGEVQQKYTVDSLAQLIANPHDVRSGGRMPSLVGSMGDAYAIASYLTRAVTERETNVKIRRLVYEGEWEQLPDFESLKPIADDVVPDFEIKGSRSDDDPKHTGLVFETKIQVATSGNYEFSIASDDGSRLFVGPHRIDNDGIHPTVTRSAAFKLDAGIHPIRVEWFNRDGGYSLDVRVKDPLLGDMPLTDLIADENASEKPLLASHFEPDAAAVERGKQLFQSAGCGSCHAYGSSKPAAQDLPALADLKTDRGCLATAVSRPAVDYHLSPRQRTAIESAINQRRESRSDAVTATDQELVHLTLAGMNCYACHRRGPHGGPEAGRDAMFLTTMAEMGWEGRLPPPLDGVGDKLQSSYLSKVFAEGANERSYMHTRMPGFGAGHLEALRESLAKLDQQQAAGDQPGQTEIAAGDVLDGRKLVGAGGLSCIKCHSYNNIKGGGIGAIDLLAMPNRIRPDWFVRYLQDPTKYRPGTRMPNSFPEGRSSYTKLYDGDPHKQIEAMWSYLAAGDSEKEPSGLRAGAIILAASDRPLFYRNFFEGVSGRGIAVGFPDEVNLIWDAERMGLNTVWKNEFIDAARHWTGRGQGRTTPAGDQVNQLETWTPMVAGDSIDMTWPGESGRELGYRFRGYRLDEAGNPTFAYTVGQVRVEDSIKPVGNAGFARTLSLAPAADAQTAASEKLGWIWRIARGQTIQGSGGVFKIGAVSLTITGAECELVRIDGQTELRARIPGNQPVTLTQTIQW